MNKSQLIESLALEMKIPTSKAATITNTIIDTMIDALAQGEHIEIRDYGSFSVKSYNGYTGKNPKTGEDIRVAPKKLPFFKAGKDLKQRVNDGAG